VYRQHFIRRRGDSLPEKLAHMVPGVFRPREEGDNRAICLSLHIMKSCQNICDLSTSQEELAEPVVGFVPETMFSTNDHARSITHVGRGEQERSEASR
jgi:hypothetical protein